MFETLSTPTLANAIGCIALAMSVLALIRTSNKGLLAILGSAVLLWGIHYGLLGSVSGLAVHLVAAASLFVAHAIQAANAPIRVAAGIAFSLAGVGATAYFGTGMADALAAVGCIIMTMTQFTGRGSTLRIGFMAGETVFFGFALILGSVPGMVVTAGNFVAGAIGLYRRHQSRRGAYAASPALSTD